jgi:hypothetical protein
MNNARETGHDIPNRAQCRSCHDSMHDRLIGLSAIQLAHSLGGLNLEMLVESGRLSQPPSTEIILPGDEVTQGALGTLHANCGHCHNVRSGTHANVDLELWLETGALASVESTSIFRTTVGVPFQGVPPSPETPETRITAGNAGESAVYYRMSVRDPLVQMPPLATEAVDEAGLSSVAEWIEALVPEQL